MRGKGRRGVKYARCREKVLWKKKNCKGEGGHTSKVKKDKTSKGRRCESFARSAGAGSLVHGKNKKVKKIPGDFRRKGGRPVGKKRCRRSSKDG